MSTITLNKTSLKAKTITTILAIATAIVLPQLFHVMGIISGTGAMLGSVFLPMHIPVFVAGLMAGPVVGIIAGAVSPLVSFAISGMPAAALLPFMMFELAGYGLVSGLLVHVKMPVFAKLVIAQVAGRVVRGIAIAIAVFGFGNQAVQLASIWTSVAQGLPGILLQWAIIPLLLYRMEGLKKYYD